MRKTIWIAILAVLVGAPLAGCGILPMGGGGGGGSSYWETSLPNYVKAELTIPENIEAGTEVAWKAGDLTTSHWGVVGQEGDHWIVENVVHAPTQETQGIVRYKVDADGTIETVWIGEAGGEGTETDVPEPQEMPEGQAGEAGEAPEATITRSEETITVPAGEFETTHVHVESGDTVTDTWYAQSVMPDLAGTFVNRDEEGNVIPGALVKSEAAGQTTVLELHSTDYEGQLEVGDGEEQEEEHPTGDDEEHPS